MKNLVFIALSLILTVSPAFSDERLFTFSYEPDVLPKGGVEFEQWITNKAGREGTDYSRWDLREEIEYGLTDKLTTALYLNFRDTYNSPHAEDSETTRQFKFNGVSSEWKYQLINPHIDPVGVLLYGEVTVDSDKFELEEKLVLGSYFAERWAAVINAELEHEWKFEHGETEKESALTISAGLSYRTSDHWSVGLEMFNERKFAGVDFNEYEASGWYAGPNIHYGDASWWITLTVAPQIPLEGDRDLEDFERVHTRLIAGIIF